MPRSPADPTPLLDAFLRGLGLSEATVFTYRKHIVRALKGIEDIRNQAAVNVYDATLSVKMRENFRASWRKFVAFAAGQNVVLPSPPCRACPRRANAAQVPSEQGG